MKSIVNVKSFSVSRRNVLWLIGLPLAHLLLLPLWLYLRGSDNWQATTTITGIELLLDVFGGLVLVLVGFADSRKRLSGPIWAFTLVALASSSLGTLLHHFNWAASTGNWAWALSFRSYSEADPETRMILTGALTANAVLLVLSEVVCEFVLWTRRRKSRKEA